MNKLIEKKEYKDLIFFHGVCVDNKHWQAILSKLELSIDEINHTFTKFSRYCVVGKFNYEERVLELGLSMIEFPYPYIRKKAREIAIQNLNNKNHFSLNIPFDLLYIVVNYTLGDEIKSFNKLNMIFKNYRRGSLIHFFKDKKISKLLL